MTPRHPPSVDPTAYTPSSDERRKRRSDDADDAELRRWWQRVVKPTEIVAGAALILGSLAVAGFHRESPLAAIANEAVVRAHADTTLHQELLLDAARVDALKQQVDALSDRVLFMAYMQCQQAKASRSVIPAWATARCDSIIQKRLAP